MINIKTLKKECRSSVKKSVAEMTGTQKADESIEIVQRLEQFLSSYPQENKNIVLYYPLSDEVDVRSLLDSLQGRWAVFLPVIAGDDIALKSYLDKSSLKNGARYNIPEPVGDEVNITPNIVIVPGLAFNFAGSRMGRGKGYYDKFLSRFPKAIKIALSYKSQLIDNIPVEPHDYKMDVVITADQLTIV